MKKNRNDHHCEAEKRKALQAQALTLSIARGAREAAAGTPGTNDVSIARQHLYLYLSSRHSVIAAQPLTRRLFLPLVWRLFRLLFLSRHDRKRRLLLDGWISRELN